MAKTLDSNIVDQITSNEVVPYFALNADFGDIGSLRIWTGYGEIAIYNSQIEDYETYLGSGNLLSISPIEETAETKASGVQVSLSGIPSDILSAALQAQYQNRQLIIYFGVLDKTTGLQSGDPYKIFTGLMDIMTINESAELLTISVNVENKLLILERICGLRYTNEEQQRLFSGDKGLEYVGSLQDKNIIWGSGGGSKVRDDYDDD